MRWRWLSAFCLVACQGAPGWGDNAADGGHRDNDGDVPPGRAGGPVDGGAVADPVAFVLRFAPGDVQPGAEGVHCQDIVTPSRNVWVSGWRVAKSGVHHVNVWRRKPNTNPLYPVAAPCGGGWGPGTFMLDDSSSQPISESLPDGDAMLIPASSSLIFDVHYLNSGADPISETVTVEFLAAATHVREVTGLVLIQGGTALNLSPGATVTRTFVPTLPQHADDQIVSLMGHMHTHGVSETMTVDGVEVYRSSAWAEPPIVYPPNLKILPTSKVSWSCTFANPGTTTIQWGSVLGTSEMCQIFGLATGPHWESQGK